MLSIKGLEKTYGSFKALNGLDLTINKGEIFGFIGPNGAGKSTTMKIVAGLLTPDSGEVYVDGIDAIKRNKNVFDVNYEEYGKDLYPPEHMEKIAQLFEVPVDMLLDDYNLFLRNGQGEQIKAIRTKLGLTQKQYADKLGVSLGSLKQWEQNRKQIFKSTWEKYFKQGLEKHELF